MKKYCIVWVFALLFTTDIPAFEPGQLSLDSVSNFDKGDAAFSVRHRFFGDITKAEDFFGLDDGANTLLGLRYAPLHNIIVAVHHISQGQEYNVRIGYAYHFEMLHAQLNVNTFTFKAGGVTDRQENVFANLVLQSPIFFEWVRMTTNIGYDNYYEKVGAGLGIEIHVQNFLPEIFTFTQTISLLAEYYTKHQNLSGLTRDNNAYTLGIKFQTYGHHFELLGTNSSATDPRTMMQGTNSNKVHFAFNINRKF